MASLFTNGKFQATNALGSVAGAQLYTMSAGGSWPGDAQATYTSQAGSSVNDNPVTCDTNGQANVWIGPNAYRMTLKDASGSVIWDVDNIPGSALSNSVLDYGAVGDGSSDDTAAFQAFLTAHTGEVIVMDLAGRSYAITTVAIPNAKAVRVQNGKITVIGTNSLGLSKRTTTSPQSGGTFSKYDLTVDNVQFVRSVTGGACVDIKLAWQDSTGGIVLTPSCNFQLSNGAVGVRASRSFFNVINGRFVMDTTSTGFLCDASEVVTADAYPSCPFVTTFGQGSFSGGIGFDQSYVSASTWNSFEGFTFGPDWAFYASICRATKYNFLQFNGTHMVSSRTVLDSGNNTVICGGYWDRGTNAEIPLTFKRTLRNVDQVSIGGGVQFNAQITTGDLIWFSDASALGGTQMTNITIDNVMFVGGINDTASRIVGINCDDVTIRNLNVTGAQNFQNMWSCIKFSKAINRSTIRRFVARDVSWYAENASTGYGGGFNQFPGLYVVILANLVCANYTSSGAIEPVMTQFFGVEPMQRAPAVTISSINSYFGAGYFTISTEASYENGVQMQLTKNVAAVTANRGGCSATLSLDASQYLAPL